MKLKKLLLDRKKMLEEFLVLTEKQTKAIEDNDLDQLSKLISRKDVLIDNMTKVDSELVDFELDSNNRNLVDENNNIVKKIMEIDQHNQELFKTIKDELGNRLKQSRKSRQTHSVYRGKDIGINAIFIDKKK